jgi:hypothetical protein
MKCGLLNHKVRTGQQVKPTPLHVLRFSAHRTGLNYFLAGMRMSLAMGSSLITLPISLLCRVVQRFSKLGHERASLFKSGTSLILTMCDEMLELRLSADHRAR